MRLAAIDVGSNSILLLVADVVTGVISSPVREEVRITRLGERLASDRSLPSDAIERTLAVMAEYVSLANELGSASICAAATAAVREASNGAGFARVVQEQLGLVLRVISPAEEARLALLGVLSNPELPTQELLVLDIGGGSTEVIAGSAEGVRAIASVPVGSVRLRHLAGDAASVGDVPLLLAAAAESVTVPLGPLSLEFSHQRLVGVGGTITTLAAIDLRLGPAEYHLVEGHPLSRARVLEVAAAVAEMPLAERARVPGLPQGREDTIVPGAALLLACMDALGRTELIVSRRGLRYGMIIAASRTAL